MTTDQKPELQHEAGDRVSVLADQFERHVSEHPYVSGDPHLSELAKQASDAINTLYQAIWQTED